MALRLSGQTFKLSMFFCPSIPKAQLDRKKTTPDIGIFPKSLGAVLEY